MKAIKVSGTVGIDAKIKLRVKPSKGTAIIEGDGAAAKIFNVVSEFTSLGPVVTPMRTVVYHAVFHRRPWSLDVVVEATGSASFSVDSDTLNLPRVLITSPDIFNFEVQLAPSPSQPPPG